MVDTVLRDIAANVRRTRLRRVLTQEKLAELSAVDIRYLQRIERGSANMSVAVLIGLANALEVKLTALFRPGKPPPPPKPGRPRKRPTRRSP